MAFNLEDGQKAERKLLVTAINVGTSTSRNWQIVGVGVEDSSIEFNPDTETVTDILGITTTTVNKLETSQDLDPMTVMGGSPLAEKLWDQIKNQKLSEMSMYEVMIISAFNGESGSYEAEVHENCTVTPQSIGGSSYVDMPITINYSNDKIHGTVNDYRYGKTITFTES